MSSVTINNTQRVFVIPEAGGFSCLGFDVAFKRLAQFAKTLGQEPPNNSAIGTLEQYQQYREAERKICALNSNETFFEPGTAVEVQGILERYRLSGKQLRIFLGDPVTGLDWLSEYDVVGRVGRSMGPMRIPLLCAPRAAGGGALLSSNILRIIDCRDHPEVYRHPRYQEPDFTIDARDGSGLPYEVSVAGRPHLRFSSKKRALNWVSFMQGTRMTRSTDNHLA